MMDFEFMRAQLPLYTAAALLTMRIAAAGILLSAAAGFLCAMLRYLRAPVLKRLAGGYIELSRNTPLLIQLFFLYFGLPRIGIILSSESCAVIGLTFLGGSYMAEAFRSGLDNVPVIQEESGLSLGLTKQQVFRLVILPQAVSTSIPLFCSNIIFLIKETSVFSAVALADLMFVAKDLIGVYYKTDEALLLLVLFYLIILLPVSLICSIIERRVRYGGFGNQGPVSGK